MKSIASDVVNIYLSHSRKYNWFYQAKRIFVCNIFAQKLGYVGGFQGLNFIEQIIEEDLSNSYAASDLRFRFPPEPNGFLPLATSKPFADFGLGKKYNAPVNSF